jgi:hypothetical protein
MVSGDYGAFKKKHQGDVQEFTPAAIVEYIKSAGEGFRKMQDDRELMKHVQIDARVTAELVGRMILEKEFIESTQVNMIKRELKETNTRLWCSTKFVGVVSIHYVCYEGCTSNTMDG